MYSIFVSISVSVSVSKMPPNETIKPRASQPQINLGVHEDEGGVDERWGVGFRVSRGADTSEYL